MKKPGRLPEPGYTLRRSTRRQTRLVGLTIMARKPRWRVRHHRGQLGGEHQPFPPGWIPSRND